MDKGRVILLGFLISNVAALIYEVVWGRELTYIFGTSVYAVSTVLTSFMTGLAIGSFVFGKYVDKVANPLRLFSHLEIGIGAYGIATIFLLKVLDAPYAFFHGIFHESFFFFYVQFIMAFALLLMPTVFIGGTFPVMTKLHSREFEKLGWHVSTVYTADTVGAGIGAFVSGFILIPILGHQQTIITAGLLNILIGAILYEISQEVEQ
jgi:spermidine synthase